MITPIHLQRLLRHRGRQVPQVEVGGRRVAVVHAPGARGLVGIHLVAGAFVDSAFDLLEKGVDLAGAGGWGRRE